MAGDSHSPEAFRTLCGRLLTATIITDGSALQLIQGERRNTFLMSGRNSRPLELTNGHYLRLHYTLEIVNTSDGPRLKVMDSGFQYQVDEIGKQWIFRYDYVRNPPRPHPATHFHIRGNLTETCLPPNIQLADVHFPAIRVSIEAVIRLLIEQFKIRSRQPHSFWRPLLTESERQFIQIAHRPLSGPPR